MKNGLARWMVCLATLGLANLAVAQTNPVSAAPEGFLPKLGAIKLDGDLYEWNLAVTVPIRFQSCITHLKPPHKWNGPADCGMEALCGWNEEGLCLAGFVADDDVQNDTPPDKSYEKDCIELYADGRVGDAFMKPPYTKGAYHVFVRPPVGGKAAELAFAQSNYGTVEGARVAGKPVSGGWTFESVIPWTNFPGYTPRAGSVFGLQFGLDDYDARDAGTSQPLMMSWQAATFLFMSPQKMVKWTLVEKFPKSARTSLEVVAGIDIHQVVGKEIVEASLELGRTLAGQVCSGTWAVKEMKGNVVAIGMLALTKSAAPWQDSACGGFEWTPESMAHGLYTMEVTLADSQGSPIGMSRRNVLLPWEACIRAAGGKDMGVLPIIMHGRDELVALPDPLRTVSGERIESVQQWEQSRRGEILELFRQHVYGRMPKTPYKLSCQVLNQDDKALDGQAIRKEVAITIGTAKGEMTFPVLLYLPSAAKTNPAPVFLQLEFFNNSRMDQWIHTNQNHWVRSAFLAQGIGVATAFYQDIVPDKKDRSRDGIYKLLDPDGKLAPDAGGAISAWAWGLSRIMDYLETDKQIDAKRVAVFGLSRLGKTALWAGAQDTRFAVVISGCSGTTGAALARHKAGESIESINRAFRHWFCDNYKGYANREQDLPVDQHMLLALIAPRPVYVSSASQDDWADPLGEFLSCVHATPVYQLHGLSGLAGNVLPPVDTPLASGHVGYHLRTGSHGTELNDLKWFAEFIHRHWQAGK